MQTMVQYKFFYSVSKETSQKPSKVAAAKNVSPSVHVIDTTCFDECFLNVLFDNWSSFFYLGFFSRTFTIHRTARERGRYLSNFSLPLPLASRTLRHQLRDCCRELTSAHSQQPDSDQELLFSKGDSFSRHIVPFIETSVLFERSPYSALSLQ